MSRLDKVTACVWAVLLLLDIVGMVYDIVKGGNNIEYWVEIIILTIVILALYFRINYMQKTINQLRTENWLHLLIEWQQKEKPEDE